MKAPYVYCIFRLDSKYWERIDKDLIDRGFEHIKVYIPSVRILKRSRKGEPSYAKVPMLFNYGFMRMNSDLAYNRIFLKKLKKSIPGISAWVNTTPLHPKKKRVRIDTEDWDDFSKVATVSRREVKKYMKEAVKNNIFLPEDIIKLQVGTYVILRGYPFEGIAAEISDVDLKDKVVTVILYPENGKITVKVPLDNVAYSIYHNFNEDTATSDKDLSNLTGKAIDDALSYKQY